MTKYNYEYSNLYKRYAVYEIDDTQEDKIGLVHFMIKDEIETKELVKRLNNK